MLAGTEIETVQEGQAALALAKREEEESEEGVGALKKSEDEARVHLETCRVEVKNVQRHSGEIETQVEEARASVAQQAKSLADIENTIRQTGGGENPSEEDPDSMLF